MAVQPPANEAFLREVEEELRAEQFVNFWRRHGTKVLVGILVALAIIAGVLIWRDQQNKAQATAGAQLSAQLEALRRADIKGTRAPLAELAKNGGAGHRTAARFLQADVLLSENKLPAAAAKFAEIVNDGGAPRPLRDLALIRQTSAEFDTLAPAKVIERLSPLAAADSTWLGSAGELVASAYLKQGQRAKAAEIFKRIAEAKDMPESLRDRASQMAGSLGIDTIAQQGDKK